MNLLKLSKPSIIRNAYRASQSLRINAVGQRKITSFRARIAKIQNHRFTCAYHHAAANALKKITMIASKDYWVVIPGYQRYQINPYGDVMRISTSQMMTIRDTKGLRSVHLWDGEKQVCKSVAHLVAETFLKPQSGKTHVWHKNGLYRDNFVGNLEWVTRHELSCRMAAANPRRKPIAKKSITGETVNIYASMAEAARQNYISERAVRNRCFNLVTDPFLLDGHDYVFER